MDKMISARIDELSYHRLNQIARLLKTSKKKILENAIAHYAQKVESDKKVDIFDQTFGCWKRDESPQQTIQSIRDSMNKSLRRHFE